MRKSWEPGEHFMRKSWESHEKWINKSHEKVIRNSYSQSVAEMLVLVSSVRSSISVQQGCRMTKKEGTFRLASFLSRLCFSLGDFPLLGLTYLVRPSPLKTKKNSTWQQSHMHLLDNISGFGIVCLFSDCYCRSAWPWLAFQAKTMVKPNICLYKLYKNTLYQYKLYSYIL